MYEYTTHSIAYTRLYFMYIYVVYGRRVTIEHYVHIFHSIRIEASVSWQYIRPSNFTAIRRCHTKCTWGNANRKQPASYATAQITRATIHSPCAPQVTAFLVLSACVLPYQILDGTHILYSRSNCPSSSRIRSTAVCIWHFSRTYGAAAPSRCRIEYACIQIDGNFEILWSDRAISYRIFSPILLCANECASLMGRRTPSSIGNIVYVGLW